MIALPFSGQPAHLAFFVAASAVTRFLGVPACSYKHPTKSTGKGKVAVQCKWHFQSVTIGSAEQKEAGKCSADLGEVISVL